MPQTTQNTAAADGGEVVAGIAIPDTQLARDVTSLARRSEDDTLFDHSRRVYLLGMLKARHQGLDPDAELAYVGAMCHDLGLTPDHRSTDQRFEIDSADIARQLLLDHGRTPEEARQVWLSIALHTTPEVPLHLEPEVAVVTLGVEADVLGLDLDQVTAAQRAEILAAHPRPEFKQRIVAHFHEGMRERPDTTFGTMNDDVLVHCEPGFERTDFVQMIQDADWPE